MAQEYEHDDAPEPIKVAGAVTVDGSIRVREESADYGSLFTIAFAGTEQPQQLIPRDDHRKRAQITVSGTGPVFLGSEAQAYAVARGAPVGFASGALIPTGVTVPWTSKQPLWVIPDGTHTATVSVITERWEK